MAGEMTLLQFQKALKAAGLFAGSLDDAPSQALQWAVEALCKAGTLSIIGVYPQTARSFPIGTAMNKNLTINMGNCNHRKYLPMLVDLVQSGVIDPTQILTQTEPMMGAIEAYKAFDAREPGWIKVELLPRKKVTRSSASERARGRQK